jgi:UDP-N-acetylmuramoyl-tripeptide--D-alanyl-D-alanine ligase
MDDMQIAALCQAINGRLLQGEPTAVFSRVSTDSRQIQPGALFIALKGERFDGHAYVAGALAAGAAGAVGVSRGGGTAWFKPPDYFGQ